MASLKTLSTPQVARANSIEKTATTTIRLEDSDLEGSVTLFFNSSKDSLIYVNMRLPFLFHYAREERLELPTPGFGDQCSTN